MNKYYILDTSVLIDTPECLEILRNDENEIFIPYSVVLELDRLKRKPDLSYIVSSIGHLLERDENVRYIKHADVSYTTDEVNDETILQDVGRFISELSADESARVIVVSNDRLFV